MTFEESHTIPSQQNVNLVQKLRFGLVSRGDEGTEANPGASHCRAAIGNVLSGTSPRRERGESPDPCHSAGGVGNLVPLAQKRERGRVRLGELAALGQLVPFGGLERV